MKNTQGPPVLSPLYAEREFTQRMMQNHDNNTVTDRGKSKAANK